MAAGTPTRKQSKVLGYLIEGKSVKDISRRMKISTNGVYGHMRKLRTAGLIDQDGQPLSEAPAAAPDAAATGNGGSSNGSDSEALAEVENILIKARTVAQSRQQQISGRVASIESEIESLNAERQSLVRENEALDDRIANVKV